MRAHFLFSILEGYISENSYKFVIAFSYNELYRKRIIQLYIYLIKLNHIKMGGNNMCQIFGYSSSKKIKLNSLLREFYSHSDRHPNGWGLALLDGIHANIERETLQASKSNYLEERFTEDIAAPVLLAHIRRATIGNVELRNCHPFTGFDKDGRRWTLIHNGTIFDFQPMHEYVKKQKGETDSERILLCDTGEK